MLRHKASRWGGASWSTMMGNPVGEDPLRAVGSGYLGGLGRALRAALLAVAAVVGRLSDRSAWAACGPRPTPAAHWARPVCSCRVRPSASVGDSILNLPVSGGRRCAEGPRDASG